MPLTYSDKSPGDSILSADFNEIKVEFNNLVDSNYVVIGDGASVDVSRNNVAIGHDASAPNSGISSVAIGDGATASLPRSVAIGLNAEAVLDSTYGAAGGDESVAIGENSKTYGWRGVAIGGDAHAAHTSSLAVGAGSFCGQTHGVAIGRGATLFEASDYTSGDVPTFIFGATSNNKDIHVYFANTYANQTDTPPPGIGIGSTTAPSDWEVCIHGRDALDMRSSPSESDVAGGHLAMCGGYGTGTATGGEVRFYSAPAGGSSNNTKNTKSLAAKIDAATGVDTRFFLLDVTDGTVKRVEFGADNSGGIGKKVLVVDN